MSDARITQLAAEAGSEEAVSRGRKLAMILMIVGGAGALASSVRPLLRTHFRRPAGPAGSGKTRTAAAAVRAAQAVDPAARMEMTGDVLKLLDRLRELQTSHRERHPLWYGQPTTEMIAQEQQRLAHEGEMK